MQQRLECCGTKILRAKSTSMLCGEKITIFTRSHLSNIAAPPPPSTSLMLDKKGMMDGIDDDDDVEDKIDEERKGGMGGPVPDVDYSTPYSRRGGKKVKIKQEISYGTRTATFDPCHNYPALVGGDEENSTAEYTHQFAQQCI